jgi:hypothetical protein
VESELAEEAVESELPPAGVESELPEPEPAALAVV